MVRAAHAIITLIILHCRETNLTVHIRLDCSQSLFFNVKRANLERSTPGGGGEAPHPPSQVSGFALVSSFIALLSTFSTIE